MVAVWVLLGYEARGGDFVGLRDLDFVGFVGLVEIGGWEGGGLRRCGEESREMDDSRFCDSTGVYGDGVCECAQVRKSGIGSSGRFRFLLLWCF